MSLVTLPQDILDNIGHQLAPDNLNDMLWTLKTQKKDQKRDLMSIFVPRKIFMGLYGTIDENTFQDFEKDIRSLKGKKRLKMQFDFLKEIENILLGSKRSDHREIIWKGEKIGNKRKYCYSFQIKTFWNSSINEIKNHNFSFLRCGCVPYCWRCLKKAKPSTLKIYDQIIAKAKENNRFYRAEIISMQIIGKATIRFFPYLGEPLLNFPQQEVTLKEIYEIPDCWSSYTNWEDQNPVMKNRIFHKAYDVPFSYVFLARRIAKTALALI